MKEKNPYSKCLDEPNWSRLLYNGDRMISVKNFVCDQREKDHRRKSQELHNRFDLWSKLVSEPIKKENTKEEELESLRKRFYDLLPMLSRKHAGKYVAVGDDFVEINENEDELFDIVLKKHGYRTIYLNQIVTTNKGFKLRGPRIKNG